MLKYTVISEAQPGSHALPIRLSEQEAWILQLKIGPLTPGDRIVFEGAVAWENTLLNQDIGDIELSIRRGDPAGHAIYWTQDSCYHAGETDILHTETVAADGTATVFYLTARSTDGRAIVTGPLHLQASVYD